MPATQLTRDALLLALEKHGLPVWGTDEELQVRYDRNELGGVKAKPVATSEPKSFRGRPKGSGASKVTASNFTASNSISESVDDEPELKNELLANKASAVPVDAEEVTSDNANESKDA